ncbi:hypothetical protein Trydic_g8278 [Trypoxylus dichotomus]
MSTPLRRRPPSAGGRYRRAHDIPAQRTARRPGHIVVMKDVAQFHQLTVLNELSSDHNPVLLQLGQAAPEDEEPRMRQTVSWSAFADHLSAHIGPITAIGGPIELEAAVRQVTERVSDSARYATNTSRAVDDGAFIPREVRDLIREKNQLRRQWQRTNGETNQGRAGRIPQQPLGRLHGPSLEDSVRVLEGRKGLEGTANSRPADPWGTRRRLYHRGQSGSLRRNPRATMQPGLRERGRGPYRAYPSSGTRSPHGRGRRRRTDITYVTGRGESHRSGPPRPRDRTASPTALSSTLPRSSCFSR